MVWKVAARCWWDRSGQWGGTLLHTALWVPEGSPEEGPVGSLLAAGLSEDPRPWDSVPGSLGGCGPKDHSSQALGEELVLWEAGRGLAPREVAVSRWGGGP